jgi:hypothetical protein
MRTAAVVVFDGSSGPAYAQIIEWTLNGKTELRNCEGAVNFDKRGYDEFPKMQLAGASSLERGADGVLRLTLNSKPVCVVPANLKFDKSAEMTPAEAAEQATTQGVVVSSSIQGSGIPPFKPGVQLVFVVAPDDELAQYLLAGRIHSIPAWQAFLSRYGSSSRAPDARSAIAAICEESAESAVADYRKSAASPTPDLSRLKQAQQQTEQANKTIAGYPPAHQLQEQIGKEIDALLEVDRMKLQAFRKALAEHTTGYAQLAAAKQHVDQVLDVNPQYAPAINLHSEIANEERKLSVVLQNAEGLMASKRYDEALAALGPYRVFAPELSGIESVVSGAYTAHFTRGQELAKSLSWEQAVAEFHKALEVRSDSKEGGAALKDAELQFNTARNRQAAERAVVASNGYAEKGQSIEAYDTLANLPDDQQSFVTDQLMALQKDYIAAASRRAQKLQEIHFPIRGRADEDAVRQAYELLDRASELRDDPAMKLRLDLLSDKISTYYVDQAKRYLEKPMASRVGIGWLYLGEAERYKPNLDAVKTARAQYSPAYQLRAKLSLGVILRDQTSRRDSVGFADQMRDAIVSGLESSGLPIKVLRQFNETEEKETVQPNFLLVGEILEHRVVKNANLETLQSKYRAGTREVKSPAWLQANSEYEAAQQQLATAQRRLSDAQTQHKKKEIVLAANETVAATQKQVADTRRTLEATEQTRLDSVIEPYNYSKKNIDLTAIVDMAFRITDQSGTEIEPPVPIRKDNHQVAVVLENVKPEDTEGVRKQGTEPDENQFLTDLEIQARDILIKSVGEKAKLLPGKILNEARKRAQQGDVDGAAEEYVLYWNAVTDTASPERDEAAKFLHEHFNLTPVGRF